MNRISISLILLLVALLPVQASAQEVAAGDAPRNVILFITDGFGPSMATMARDYRRDFLGAAATLTMDGIEVGSVRTLATDSRVTDSAASATAYATGVKTYNGAIAVDTAGLPLATILEAARGRGLRTGIVTTTRVTHATPASFTAHVARRSMEEEIAAQQVVTAPDVLIGGGRRFYVPEQEGGSRTDDRDLLQEAREGGFNVAQTWEEARTAQLPLLALLYEDSLPYEIDRPDDEPSLADLTALTLERLGTGDTGFFVMIEAARIDHAAHSNDAAGTLHDVLAFDEALRVALDFARRDGSTLVVSVADHETGGMSVGRAGAYRWEPEVLSRVRASHGPMIDAIAAGDRGPSEVLEELGGVDDLSEEEVAALAAAGADRRAIGDTIAQIISSRSGIGWTTGGHTGVDVKLYASGPGRDRFIGHHDNTFVGNTIAELLGLDLWSMTDRLRAGATLEVVQD